MKMDRFLTPFVQAILQLLPKLVFVLGLAFLLGTTLGMAGRLSYPYSVDWQEDNTLDAVCHLLEGKSLYQTPDATYVSKIYNPIYYYLSAMLASVTGVSYLPLRLISFLSFLATCLFLYIWVLRRAGRGGAWISVFVFAALFKLSGYFYDHARVDMLFLALTIGGCVLLIVSRKRLALISSALVFVAAVFTKQNALITVVFAMAWLLWCDRRGFVWFTGTFVSGWLMLFAVFQASSHGWYYFFAYRIVSQHGWGDPYMLFHATVRALPIFTSLFLGWVAIKGLRSEPSGKTTEPDPDLFLIMGLMAMGGMSLLHKGGYVNSQIPLYLGFAVALGQVWGWCGTYSKGTDAFRYALPTLSLFMAVQFAAVANNPLKAIPSQSERGAWEEIRAYISHLDGEVWVSHMPNLARQAGKEPLMAWDSYFCMAEAVRNPKVGTEVARCKEQMRDRLLNRIDWVVCSNRDFPKEFDLTNRYRLVDSLYRFGVNEIHVDDTSFVPRFVFRKQALGNVPVPPLP